jgi:SPP1 gp7 family putative phage head morphogenesis protein
LDEAARRANLDAWRKVYGASGKNARGVAHLDSETSFQQTGQTARDAEFINLDKLSREQILAIFGVPPFLVGVMEFANYANSSQQLKAFYNHTIMPMAKLIEDSFNNQLVEVWYGGESGLYVEFDFSGIDALREDLLKQAQVSSILVRDRIKTINEVRREMNLPDVPWGDDPPPDPFAITDLTLGHGRPTGTKGLSTRAINRESHWKAFSDTLASFEAGFAKAMRKYFRDQSQRIESKINQTFSLAMAGGHVPSGLADIIKAVGPEDLFAIYDLEAEDKLLQALTEPMYRRAVDKFGSAAARVAGQSSVWNVSDPRVANLIAEKVLLIKRINSTTKDMITAILVDAANDNATVSQVSRQLRTMFEDMAKTRSDTIARTEMIGASNGASMEGYRQAGADRKEWLSSRDADVRESHQDLDGEVVPLSSPFSNGLMFPGGSGPAEEVINCRCTLLPVVD